jgi:hypothetical protein
VVVKLLKPIEADCEEVLYAPSLTCEQRKTSETSGFSADNLGAGGYVKTR